MKGIPESVLRDAYNHSILFIFDTNKNLTERLKAKRLPQRMDINVEIQDGFKVPVKILKPPTFDAGLKYPVLVYVYGGPESQVRIVFYLAAGSAQ